MKAVAYIDLLGFSESVKNNVEEAIMMLSHFNSILSSLNFEREVHPSSGYPTGLRGLARRTSNESFEYFIPFSDSVFVASSSCSDFIMQLGSFVRQSFLFNAHSFARPENADDPTISHIIGLDTTNPQSIRPVEIPCHERPVMFRGGVAFGEVVETEPIGIFNNQKINSGNLMGEAVVRAVKMEGKVKGPRILFDQSVYDQLSDEVKIYCRFVPEKENEGLYEILWPAMGFILENKESFEQEIGHFHEIFTPAYSLWKYYKNSVVASQYECFLELIVSSAIKVYDYMGHGEFVRQTLDDVLRRAFDCDERIRIFEGVI